MHYADLESLKCNRGLAGDLTRSNFIEAFCGLFDSLSLNKDFHLKLEMKLIPNRISLRNPFASVHLISNYWLQPHKTNPQKVQISSFNIFLKMICSVAISWLQSAGLTTQRKHESFLGFRFSHSALLSFHRMQT